MSYKIEARKVAGVVVEANAAIQNKGFNTGEVVVGLAELIGRVIVESAPHRVAAEDMEKVVADHIRRTLIAGTQAQEKPYIYTGE